MLYHLVINDTPTGKEKSFETPPDFTGHPTKGGWQWLPVAFNRATIDPKTEISTGLAASVVGGQVVKSEGKRLKTKAETDEEKRASRNPLAEIDALKARVAKLETP